MTKLALINASDFLREDSLPGLGIGAIKAYLLQKQPKGLDIKIFRSRILNNIEKYKPDILGISSISFNYPDAINLARIVKEDFPNTTIILGGPHITALPKSLDPIFDIGVIGEGEETMLEIVSLFANKSKLKNKKLNSTQLKKIKGICFFDNKNKLIINPRRELIQDLDSLPHIDRSDFDDERYAYILSSRGCPYDCSYCAVKAIWGSETRLFSSQYLIKDLQAIANQGHYRITFDEPFFSSIERAEELFKLISEKMNSKMEFKVSVLPIMVTDRLCELLKNNNIQSIRFGAYSGSNKVLLRNKKINSLQLKEALAKIKKVGKSLDIGFLINSLGEGTVDFFETHFFIKSQNLKKFRFSVNFLNPGSEYWKYSVKNKLIDENNFDYQLLDYQKDIYSINEYNFVNLSGESVSSLIKWGKQIFLQKQGSNFYDNLLYILNTKLIGPFLKKFKSINVQKIIRRRDNLLYFLKLREKKYFPESILINVNSACNLNCDFCINKITRLSKNTKKDFLVKDLMKVLSELSLHKPYICLSGGEPLLNKDIFEIIRILRSNGISKIEMITNGYLLKTYFEKIILSGLPILTVSLDHYISSNHDEIRGIKGAFDKLHEGLMLLNIYKTEFGGNIQININTVVNKSNYKELSKIYDYIEKLGFIDNWYLRHLTYTNLDNYSMQSKQKFHKRFPIDNINGAIYDSNYFLEDELSILKKQLLEIKKSSFFYKTKLVVTPEKINVSKYYSGYNFSNQIVCQDVNESLQIIDGKVLSRCSFILGRLDEGIGNLWNSNKNSAFLGYIKKNGLPQCWRCTRRNYQ